ncbi:MAG: protein kinase [Planctomycetes bacterium]|nr:protein kinase [Planctomycetota bacterium]
MPAPNDALLGKIALQQGLITRDQLVECLRLQEIESQSLPPHRLRSLGAILIEHRYVSEENLKKLFSTHNRCAQEGATSCNDFRSSEELRLGKVLVSLGIAGARQIDECLRMQAERVREDGSVPRLGELLVERGYCTEAEVQQALEGQRRVALACTGCGARATVNGYDAKRLYPCRSCGSELKPVVAEPAPAAPRAAPKAPVRPLPSRPPDDSPTLDDALAGSDESGPPGGPPPAMRAAAQASAAAHAHGPAPAPARASQLHRPAPTAHPSPPPPAPTPTPVPAAPASGEDPTSSHLRSHGSGAGAPPPEVREALARAGAQFGKYVLVGELGHGGMGVVYKAWERDLGRYVALKLLQIEDDIRTPVTRHGQQSAGDDEKEIQRFVREARTAAKLRHANIAQVFDVGYLNGKHYLAMEFIRGISLRQYLRSGPPGTDTSLRKSDIIVKSRPPGPVPAAPKVRELLSFIRDIARALDYSHANGVIHRDVKPENILLAEPEDRPDARPRSGSTSRRLQAARLRAVLVDFGLARELGSASHLTVSGQIMGTPSYMSPEQADGRLSEMDGRTDVFSLGTVLYECVTGRKAFDAATPVGTLYQVMFEEPVPPRRVNPRIHNDVQTIVQKAMEKEMGRRYASAEEFADDIERYLDGEPILAVPPSFSYRLWRRATKNKAASIGGTVLLVLALGFGGYLLAARAERQSGAASGLAAAQQAFARKDFRSATEGLHLALTHEPTNEAALALLAPYEAALREAEANETRERQRLGEVQARDALRQKAEPYYVKGKFTSTETPEALRQGIVHLDKAVEIHPDFAEALFERGYRYFLLAENDRALPDLERAASLGPGLACQSLFLRGKILMDTKLDLPAAAKCFEEMLRLDPTSEFALAGKARLAVAEKRYDEALRIADEVERSGHHVDEVYLVRGYVLDQPGTRRDPAGALAAYDEALRLNPRYVCARNNRGSLYLEKGRFAEALAEYDLVLKLNPKQAETIVNKANLYRKKGEFPKALDELDKAEAVNPKLAMIHVVRGHVYTANGDTGRAKAEYGEALAADPKLVDAYVGRCMARRQANDLDGALEDAERALALDKDNGDALAAKAVTLLLQGRTRLAVQASEHAVESNPQHALSRFAHGAVLAQGTGDLAGARLEIDRALELDPCLAQAYMQRALLRQAGHDDAGSVADLDEALRLEPKNPVALNLRGLSRIQLGRMREAIADCDAALAAGGPNVQSFAVRSLAHQALKEWDAAIADLREKARLQPKDPITFASLALCLWNKGDLAGAIEEYGRTIRLDSSFSVAYRGRGELLVLQGKDAEAIGDFEEYLRRAPDGAGATKVRKALEEARARLAAKK